MPRENTGVIVVESPDTIVADVAVRDVASGKGTVGTVVVVEVVLEVELVLDVVVVVVGTVVVVEVVLDVVVVVVGTVVVVEVVLDVVFVGTVVVFGEIVEIVVVDDPVAKPPTFGAVVVGTIGFANCVVMVRSVCPVAHCPFFALMVSNFVTFCRHIFKSVP